MPPPLAAPPHPARPAANGSSRIDALAGVALAAVTLWWLAAGSPNLGDRPPFAATGAVAAAVVAPALVRSDVVERRLPNAWTLPLLVAATLGLVATGLVTGAWWGALAAAAVAALLLLTAIAGGLGMGDVKLGAGLALASGALDPVLPLWGLAAAVMVGGVAGVVALAAGQRALAFGPWLLLGHGLAIAAAA